MAQKGPDSNLEMRMVAEEVGSEEQPKQGSRNEHSGLEQQQDLHRNLALLSLQLPGNTSSKDSAEHGQRHLVITETAIPANI